jgi:DNA-binding transcriptional LysR family regulator
LQHMDVELRHMRAFVVVAQSKSFTRAAEQLLITQPALTRTVQQLESALQVTLLDRSSRHLRLTDVGGEFLRSAERLLAEFDRTIASVKHKVSIRLGFSWLLPDPWAQDVISRFEQMTGNSVTLIRCDDPLDDVQRASIDIALVRGAIPVSAPVRRVHLFDEERVAVCSEQSPLAAYTELNWDDVPQWPLVVNTVSGTTGPWSWPAGQGPKSIIETTNFDEWLESVAADRGIGVIPHVAMRRSIHPAVRFIPLAGAPTTSVSVIFVPNARNSLIHKFAEAAVTAV